MALLLGALSGCGEDASVWLGLPAEFRASAAAIFAVEGDGAPRLVAVEPDPALKVELIARGERSALWALLYDQPLADLGLEPGPLVLAPEGTDRRSTRPIPAPARIVTASLIGRRTDGWAPAPALSATLTSLRLPGPAHALRGCTVFEETRFAFSPAVDATFAIALDSTSALVGLEDGRFFRATLDGIEEVSLPVPDGVYYSAHLDARGRLWLGGVDMLVVGRLDDGRPFETVAEGELGRLEWLEGPPGGDGSELFALSAEGGVWRFLDGRPQVLLPAGVRQDWRRGLAVLGPGEVLAVGLHRPILRWSAADGWVDETSRAASADAMVAVEHLAGRGVFAGTLIGEVLSRDRDGRWEHLSGSPLALPVNAIVPIAEGILAAGGGGNAAEWRPGEGFCPSFVVSSATVKHAVPLQGAVVLAGLRPTCASTSAILVLRPAPR